MNPFILLLAALTLGACSDRSTDPQSSAAPTIALQIDVDNLDAAALEKIGEELQARKIPATLFIHPVFARRYSSLVHQLYQQGFEIALLGPALTDTASYQTQLTTLSQGYQAVQGCMLCSRSQPIAGFRPAGFLQNQDTYRILDSLQIAYNAGFQSQRIYAGQHQQDTTPYPLAGHRFMAVPVSTVVWKGERLCLSSATCRALPMSPETWEGMLIAALEEARTQHHPLIPVLHNQIDSPYWNSVLRFLDYATQLQVHFVTTEVLVLEYTGY